MKFAFRTDASFQIGIGHVMRCLTLAAELSEDDHEVFFICRELDGNLIQVIEAKGFKVFKLQHTSNNIPTEIDLSDRGHQDWLGTSWECDAIQVQEVLKNTQPDWLIVDHYSLDKRWELKLKSKVRFIMVIDDLVDRDHYCDLLLDQNFGRKENDYETLLGNECKTLIGPNFAILRPEFEKFRIDSLKNRMANPNCKNLLISLGGVDKDNITTSILNALDKCQGSLDLKITVVIGKNCPWQNEISIMASVIKWPTKVLIDVGNMAELMACVDFSIGAAGSTSWERCALGIPSILVSIAANQENLLTSLTKANLCVGLKLSDNIPTLTKRIEKAINLLKQSRQDLIFKSSNLVDGKGVKRIKDSLYELS